jgi:hypothetical protein
MKKIFVLILSFTFIQLYPQGFLETGKIEAAKKGVISVPSINNSSKSSGIQTGNRQVIYDSNYVLTNIDVDRSPQQVMIPPGTQKAFVLCQGTAVIKIIDLVTATVENTIELNTFPIDMTMNSDGSKIFIANLSVQPPVSYPPDDCGTMGIAISASPVIVINTQTQSIDTSFMNICSIEKVILNSDETIMYLIGSQDYITSYDMNTYSLLNNYNLSVLSGNTSQPFSAALADSAQKIFFRSVVFVGPNVQTHVQVLDLSANTVHLISYDTLGYSSSSWCINDVMMSPDSKDVFVDVGSSSVSPHLPATFIYNPETEALKKIVTNLSTTGKYISFSDSTAYFDGTSLFGNKILFDHRNYSIIESLDIGGCSGVVSPDKKTLYLTQIGAHHNEGVTYGSPQKYDITFLDIPTGTANESFVSDQEFDCSFERMMAINSGGDYLITTNSALNTVSVLHLIPPAAIREKWDFYDLTIYPNPNTGIFSLDIISQQNDDLHISIYNVLGEIVFQGTATIDRNHLHMMINLAGELAGVYNLVVTGRNGSSFNKIILQ